MGKTIFEKIWDEHVIVEREDGDVLLYIDRQNPDTETDQDHNHQ